MVFIFTIVFMSLCVSLITADYSYKNAYKWANEFPQCGGSLQSPIDISFERDSKNEIITFENQEDSIAERMILENDGHTLKLLFQWPNDPEKLPYLYGGPLDGEYIKHSYQFRWGSDINYGSEHRIDSKSYAMEMQVVYYNKKFGSYEEAEGSENGLVLYALFYVMYLLKIFKVYSQSQLGEKESDFLTKIIENIPEVSEPGTSTNIKPFKLADYFDQNEYHAYIIYPGSLTHPPCTESIPWIISDRVIQVTEEQVRAFQSLKLLNNDDHNTRPLQPINGRKATFAVKS